MTELAFVVGSGRCGTNMITKLLAGVDHIEAHHEYVRDYHQKVGTQYHAGLRSKDWTKDYYSHVYESAAHYSDAKIFLDSSNKLTWVVDVLKDFDPRLIHLVRDGRKVVSSFLHKLNIYDDRHTEITRKWMSYGGIIPPPNEEYWWPVPPAKYNQFQRICWYWVESNRHIMKHTDNRFKLEDLTTSRDELTRLLNYLDVEYNESFMSAMQKPKHVYVPVDFPLSGVQNEQFSEIAGDLMNELEYSGEEYRVKYQM